MCKCMHGPIVLAGPSGACTTLVDPGGSAFSTATVVQRCCHLRECLKAAAAVAAAAWRSCHRVSLLHSLLHLWC